MRKVIEFTEAQQAIYRQLNAIREILDEKIVNGETFWKPYSKKEWKEKFGAEEFWLVFGIPIHSWFKSYTNQEPYNKCLIKDTRDAHKETEEIEGMYDRYYILIEKAKEENIELPPKISKLDFQGFNSYQDKHYYFHKNNLLERPDWYSYLQDKPVDSKVFDKECRSFKKQAIYKYRRMLEIEEEMRKKGEVLFDITDLEKGINNLQILIEKLENEGYI